MTQDIKKVGDEKDAKKGGSGMNDAVRATEEIRKWDFQTMGITNLAASLETNIETGLTSSSVKAKQA